MSWVSGGLTIRLWPVEENSEHPPNRFSTELHVKYFKPETTGNPIRNPPDLKHEIFVAHRYSWGVLRRPKHKKWANAHFCRIDLQRNISRRKRHRQRLGCQPVQHSGVRNSFADVLKATYPGHHPFETHPKSAVRDRSVATEI